MDTDLVTIGCVIVLIALGRRIVEAFVRAYEVKAQMRLQAPQQDNAATERLGHDLRSELAQLRDTSTQFALSMDHTLKRIEQRVEFLERKTGLIGASPSVPDPPMPRAANFQQTNVNNGTLQERLDAEPQVDASPQQIVAQIK